MLHRSNSIPTIPQSQQSEQFPQCSAPSPNAFNMSGVSAIPDEAFKALPQMQNYAHTGNTQMMCSTPQNNNSVRMIQMNKKWQQSQGIGYQRQAPYPQAHGVRQSLQHSQSQNIEFSQNQMQNRQSCRYASWEGQTPNPDGQNITPVNTPNYHNQNRVQNQLMQNDGHAQHYDGHLKNRTDRQMNRQSSVPFQPTPEYINDSGAPTNQPFNSPCPSSNFGTPESGPIASPGNILGPSQAQHWLVQKYKQRAINNQMDNSMSAMSGQSQHSFIKTEPQGQFTPCPEPQQFQAGNSQTCHQNSRTKPPSSAPNVCIDKNSNFIPISRQQNGIGQTPSMSSGTFNTFRQPAPPCFQMKKEHVSFDDNPMYSNESFGSMVTNVSNTTPRLGHNFDGSLLMNAMHDATHDPMTPSPGHFHDKLGPTATDLSATFSPPDPNNISDDQLTSIVIGSQEQSPAPWQPDTSKTTPAPQQVKTLSGPAHDSKQCFIRNLVCDKSKAFRSHPLFPLLRDLIIADMNFNSPTFPFRLIANLPTDFNKLLHNYLQRNRTNSGQNRNAAVEGVIMDALKYAHQSLIGKSC
jgi:hypothetical protein